MPRSATLPEWETFDPMLVNQLLTKHIQRQEELWQRASTHRKQAEMANLLQLQNEELLSTIRLKDEFLHNVGQELRTPLTNMKTALTLLNSPSLKPPQKQRYMDLLARECDRQSSLITSLLDLVSLDQMAEQTTVQALSLGDIVPGVVSTYQPLAEEKGVRLAYTIPENLPAISCFPTWLKQIVINLLHNGIKFTPRGGQVWVRAKQQGDYVQLEFRDTGIGIAAGEIPKIFDRFYRVRQAVDEDMGGAGLGLTIVQKLLLHCGGSISVKSRVGDGSTFNVLLPIYRGSEEG
jgi:two-component system phosphate regulon sensor histidine kinase PhoR